MELCPGEDESQLAATESAVHDLKVVDSHFGFAFGMASMEVGEAVIVEEHDDGYPKEAADRRHASIMPAASAANADQTFRCCASRKTVGSRDYEGDTEARLTHRRSQINPVSPMQTFAPHDFACHASGAIEYIVRGYAGRSGGDP